jgi:hypothetical protein
MKGSEIKESVVFREVVVGCSIGRGGETPKNRKKGYTDINPSLDPEIASTPSKSRHPKIPVVASAHIIS